jgi:hypothetical protein
MSRKRLINLIDENGEFKNGLTFDELSGFSRSGNKKISGYLFGKNWEGPRELRGKYGLRAGDDRLKIIGKSLLEGVSISKIFKTTGYSARTVRHLRKILVHQFGEIYCKCGKPSNHSAACSWKRGALERCINPNCLGKEKKYKGHWRCTGRLFGFDGDLCRPCYIMFYNRCRRKKLREKAV